ncbi:unnamed protein product [Adineta steineri]|uniref:Endonuclease/exonuclease/phosphatase domain-containing protein n=1 Tax=Adineta steineri TaxID=433720 RepID=A0A814XA63_9BILA|nr:unnamed protein product [Adineta steineri]CAF1213638.1 unnamed protein product [Adineta steineri]
MTVRVVSYNILVPIFAEETDYYTKCQPQHLKTDYRWNLIQSQLKQEIINHGNTIICLQELSLPLLSKFELFFRELNYKFSHNLYGQQYNDYMGVGIAVPMSIHVNNISMIIVGDHIKKMCKSREQPSNIFSWIWNWYEWIKGKNKLYISDPWETAMLRSNVLICLQIMIDGRSLFIGTYHMPCLYKEPDVMAIHASVVKDLMYEQAAGQDFILAGDFNIKPQDVCYQVLTEKNYNRYNFPKSNVYEISYQPNFEQILKSAYCEKNGTEPIYTNFADTPKSSKFCETLDYIFFTGHLTVENVLELPADPDSESYPDETHPSDHLMIAATFQLS